MKKVSQSKLTNEIIVRNKSIISQADVLVRTLKRLELAATDSFLTLRQEEYQELPGLQYTRKYTG
jgi:hypothetical protein